jgi:hypothetical protein
MTAMSGKEILTYGSTVLDGNRHQILPKISSSKEIHFVRTQQSNAMEYGRRWKRYIFLTPAGRTAMKLYISEFF